ncbi:MAG TPA: alkaline phosphatase family protein [Candidatus Cybelea sp.]|nr:alkaline phosphatase family protein [Candidatus Cybelea sp.]
MIVVQENRSFNDLFYGFPGATTVKYGYDSKNERIELKPIPLETEWDVEHSAAGFFYSCNGTGSILGTDCKMNGFDKETVQCNQPGYPKCPIKNPQYSYVPASETKPYFAIGKQYVLGDQTYSSNFDESSFVGHQYLISAQAVQAANYPNGDWGCEGGGGDEVPTVGPDRQVPYGHEEPCFSDTSLGQEADDAGVSWAFYTGAIGGQGGIWSAYQANSTVYYGADWQNDIITPQTQFFTDVSNGVLRQLSWITPTCKNSDHAGCGSNTGPMWVASIVNAIGQSKYWDNTAIFIIWDDPGGWYDSEPPAYADYDGLGVRIPFLIVSAYAKQGHVSHVHYEHASILKFVEDLFGLPRLAASDKRANSPEKDAFAFNKPPRKFKSIPSKLGKEYFLRQPLDLRPPDND